MIILLPSALTLAQTNSRPTPFIGLEMRGSYSQIIDSNTNPNAYWRIVTLVPEFGFRFNHDLYVSVASGITQTLSNHKYANYKSDRLTFIGGLKVVKQFHVNEKIDYYLGLESNFNYQDYHVESTMRDTHLISKFVTTALSNGISFTVAERFNIIPMVVLSHRSPWQNDRLENGFANITITPVIRFRYNFIERTT